MSFNEKVVKGTGEIVLLEDGRAAQRFDVNSDKVSVSNEVVFIENEVFAGNKTISVQVQQGAFADVKANVFAGLSNWTFNNKVRIPLVPTLTAQAGSGSITLTWNSTGTDLRYEIYMYSAGSPQRLVGSTQETTFKVAGLENGVTYYFRIKTINTSAGTESDFSDTVSATPSVILGNEEDFASQVLQVYPNPSMGRFTIEGKLKEVSGLQIVIFDLTGRKVYEQSLDRVSQLHTELDLAPFPNGLYLLQIDNGKQSISRKLIKQ